MAQRLVLLYFLVLNMFLCKAQGLNLWATVTYGSSNNTFAETGPGILFSFNTSQNTEVIRHHFDTITAGNSFGHLLRASDGLLYGMTEIGGNNNGGTIFSYNVVTDNFTILHNLGNGSDGKNPYGSLIQARNGLLYGMTYAGGIYDGGTIFSYNITSGVETVLHSFGNSSDNDGKLPFGSLFQANDGLLYGLTSQSSYNGAGTIFSYDISSNRERALHTFSTNGNEGATPAGALIQANDGQLYGLTANGGPSDTITIGYGTIFTYNISTATETVLYTFRSHMDGASPASSLIQASDGLLYGMTIEGGTNLGAGQGVIFSFDISTKRETIVHVFGSPGDGDAPQGSLMQASDGLIYGMTWGGPVYGGGTIFNYNISTHAETVLYNFGRDSDGLEPFGDAGLIELKDSVSYIPGLASNFDQLQISPNPSTGQFIFQLPGNQTTYPTEVYNMVGQKIEQINLSNTQNTLDLSKQTNGVYFISVQTEDGIVTGKVVITK